MDTFRRPPCPFVSDPWDACYISDMRSVNVMEVVKYCGGEYRKCRIFIKRMMLLEQSEQVAPPGEPSRSARRKEGRSAQDGR